MKHNDLAKLRFHERFKQIKAMTKEEFKEAIEQAHMAGQRDAGVDPSYHSALAWFQSEIQKPVNENEDLAFVSESLSLEMLDSLEEMNVLIGHLIDEKVKFYSNDKKQIRKMQELIGKARKHYSR